MKLRRPVLVTLVPLGIAAGFYLQSLRQEIASKAAEVESLLRQVSELKSKSEALEAGREEKLTVAEHELARLRAELEKERAAAPAPAAAVGTPPAPPPVSTPEAAEQDRRFQLLRTMSTVEKTLALSPEEQAQLRDKMNSALTEGQKAESAIRDALGAKRYREYREKRLEFRQNARKEFSDQEAFILSRKLGLNPEQENLVKDLILNSQNQFFPLDEPDEEDLDERKSLNTAEWLKRELTRQDHVTAGMRNILSDEQYNRYLEIAESSAANRSHRSFVDTTEREEKQSP